MELSADFSLACARRLTKVPESHPCGRVHGHTFGIRIVIDGDIDPTLGWVMDFDDIKKAWELIETQLDHRLLNEINGLENPTSENLALWIWRELKPALPLLTKIEISETGGFRIKYRGS